MFMALLNCMRVSYENCMFIYAEGYNLLNQNKLIFIKKIIVRDIKIVKVF